MKILQINTYESPGKRFNGLAITPLLRKHGIESKHLVWEKDSQDPNVLTFGNHFTYKLNQLIAKIERKFSLQSVLFLNSSKLINMPAFKEADLIHLHIIHSGYFSLKDLAKITKLKPTVWTIHDCWAITGHCNHPGMCERWKIGCGNCPDLNINFPLLKDNTRYLFKYKQRCYKSADLELIVASKWLQSKISQSPLFENAKLHHIPFGLDLNTFHPDKGKEFREKYNIDSETLVICLRAKTGPFKGLPYIIEALKNIKTDRKICLLTLEMKGTMECFSNHFQIIDLGWIHNDDDFIAKALAASDIFLMPSIEESFGLMAIEAMACGTAIIVFDGTALPEITFAPEVGISTPKQNSVLLGEALQHLIDNPNEISERGKKGREIAEKHYSQEQHLKRIINVYENRIKKFARGLH